MRQPIPSRMEPPTGALTRVAAFVDDRTLARGVFGVSFFVGATSDQLQRATLVSGNLAMGRPLWDHSRKIYNCPGVSPATQMALRATQ